MVSRVLVCGGRDITNAKRVYADLDRLNKQHGPFETVIEGDAPGVDRMAGYWARKHRVTNLKFPAAWDDLDATGAVIKKDRNGKLYNAAAGHQRNQRMLDEGKPELVIAFPGGPGTANMVKLAARDGFRVIGVPWPGHKETS